MHLHPFQSCGGRSIRTAMRVCDRRNARESATCITRHTPAGANYDLLASSIGRVCRWRCEGLTRDWDVAAAGRRGGGGGMRTAARTDISSSYYTSQHTRAPRMIVGRSSTRQASAVCNANVRGRAEAQLRHPITARAPSNRDRLSKHHLGPRPSFHLHVKRAKSAF